ncbi:MAG: hypothetical protein IT429_25510 [Gemmataceae bacterium]|nr:hypothetical protein [Gemmataceae bacterium]
MDPYDEQLENLAASHLARCIRIGRVVPIRSRKLLVPLEDFRLACHFEAANVGVSRTWFEDRELDWRPRWRVSIHEAGHAIVALALGGDVTLAALVVGGGFTKTNGGKPFPVILAAGDAAKDLADDLHIEPPAAPPGNPVLLPIAAHKAAAEMSTGTPQNFDLSDAEALAAEGVDSVSAAGLAVEARQLLERHKGAWLELARALFDNGLVSGDRAWEIMAANQPGPDGDDDGVEAADPPADPDTAEPDAQAI